MVELAEEMLEKFDHEMIPALLVRIGQLAQDPSTQPSVAVQLCQSADRLRALLPARRPQAPVTPVRTQLLHELLAICAKLGVPGLVVADDGEFSAPTPKRYPHLLEELRGRRIALEEEEAALREQIERVQALHERLESVELRPIAAAPAPEAAPVPAAPPQTPAPPARVSNDWIFQKRADPRAEHPLARKRAGGPGIVRGREW